MNDSLKPALISVESLEIATDDRLAGPLPVHTSTSRIKILAAGEELTNGAQASYVSWALWKV